MEGAIVEARRITLANNALGDNITNKNKYRNDAFALNLQGMIYESAGDINNAFIAYRNAYEIYKSDYVTLFNVSVPAQLKEDILRTAQLSNLADELNYFKNEFNRQEYCSL